MFLISLLIVSSFLPIDEIKPGMKGYGISVFRDMKLDTFSVEVISVMRKVAPKRNLIIAKLSGQNLEVSGVVLGMSGSPVYIDNKLIGAVAYAWGFAKEPICGITPIEEMVDRKGGRTGLNFRTILPIATSFNFPESFLYELTKLLNKERIKPLFLPMGTAREDEVNGSLLPGCAVGGSLIDGDLKVAALGTLTYCKGDTIYAFGHPLFGFGEIELPLVLGKVHYVLPSYDLSFKLFTPIKEVGVLVDDYETGVMGVLNKTAQKIPMKIKIVSEDLTEEYNYTLANHEKLIPILAGFCFFSSLNFFPASLPFEFSLKSTVTISIQEEKMESKIVKVELERFNTTSLADFNFFETITAPLKTLIENPFQPIKIKEININTKIIKKRKEATLIEAIPLKTELGKNETLFLRLLFLSHQGEIFEKKIKFMPPPVSGEFVLILGNPDAPEFALPKIPPKSFSGLLKDLQEEKRGNILSAVLFLERKGILLKDKTYSFSSSYRKLLEESSTEEELPITILKEEEFEFDFLVLGTKGIELRIKE